MQEFEGDFENSLDWWDMGKFYLREVTHGYAKTKAPATLSAKRLLSCCLRTLQHQFDAGDSTAFGELCAMQELREHELRAAQAHRSTLTADGSRKERFLLASSCWSKNISRSRP